MPYSFTKIEEDKTKTIRFVFFFLIFFYFSTIWLISVLVKNYAVYESSHYGSQYDFVPLNLGESLIVLGIAFIVGLAHWSYTTADLVTKILGIVKAEKLNPRDEYHQRFKNTVEEVSVATGGRAMEAVVVPTMAMNAFAVADFTGRAVIGVTEGLLARLNRAQLEAVVGHEAAHIVTGDCLVTTVTTSMFELYSGLLRGFEAVFRYGGYRGSSRSSGRSGGGGAMAMILLIYGLLMLTKLLSYLANMFISRQREFRADAIAVRLTRDPLSLAEALYTIKYRWRGAGLPAQELKAIFISNPGYSHLDETSTPWADLFSTHPPMEKRLSVLLDLAHMDAQKLSEDIERKSQKSRQEPPQAGQVQTVQWMAHNNGQWEGPFNLNQLMTVGWMRSDTWVQRLGTKNVQRANEDTEVVLALSGNQSEKTVAPQCPKCQLPLQTVSYEGTEVYKCPLCQGTLVQENNIQRIIIREDVGFSDNVKRIAKGIQDEDRKGVFKIIKRDPETLLKCPLCKHPRTRMIRTFYTEVYRVEVDKCFACAYVWFDKDELEALQCLIESSMSEVR